jgi:hypothetical protein
MTDQDVTLEIPNASPSRDTPGREAWQRAGFTKKPKTARMAGLWGILNPWGDLWTYEAFGTQAEARVHLEKWWAAFDGSKPATGYRIVPVKVMTSVDFSPTPPQETGHE